MRCVDCAHSFACYGVGCSYLVSASFEVTFGVACVAHSPGTLVQQQLPVHVALVETRCLLLSPLLWYVTF
jgi:hypothetical protein